jgi:hypothetical protein
VEFSAGYVAAGGDPATADVTCADFVAALPRDSFGRTALDLAVDYSPKPYTLRDAGGDLARARCREAPSFADRKLGPVGEQLLRAASSTCKTTTSKTASSNG